MANYTMNEKLAHYSSVAKGEKAVKQTSKFTSAEQIAYARGQRDARNEQRKIFAIKNKKTENIKKGAKNGKNK